jgi:hypothetical protein
LTVFHITQVEGAQLVDFLLGLQDEATAFVEIDAAETLGAVGVDEDDAAFEDLGVVVVFGDGGVGRWNVEQVREFVQE